MTIEEQIPLAPLTTFHIGGAARFFVGVHTLKDLQDALLWARERNIRILILGGGSNILIRDEGFDGLVIHLATQGISTEPKGEKTLLIAEAGESWDALVERSVAEGLWGLENLSGIPGTVGGAVVGGIGAYGAAVGETLSWVEALNRESGTVQKFSAQECQFDYRTSRFKEEEGTYIVLRAAFALSAVGTPNLSYKDLAQRLKGDVHPTLPDVRTVILDIRRGKFPDLSLEGTAGSFFKNPIVSSTEAETLQHRFPGMPVFPLPESSGVKIPLAWLLDHVLNLKGTSIGGARLFEMQPLVIAATRGTPARDVRALADLVRTRAREELSLAIEEEVTIL